MGENPGKVRKRFPRKCGLIQPRLIEAREKTSVSQTVWGLRIPSCREGAKQSLSCPQKIGSQNGDPCDTVAWFCYLESVGEFEGRRDIELFWVLPDVVTRRPWALVVVVRG